jgi:hypothetical protein
MHERLTTLERDELVFEVAEVHDVVVGELVEGQGHSEKQTGSGWDWDVFE